jgi:hypothetical protein
MVTYTLVPSASVQSRDSMALLPPDDAFTYPFLSLFGTVALISIFFLFFFPSTLHWVYGTAGVF